jgi:hypothetical protein
MKGMSLRGVVLGKAGRFAIGKSAFGKPQLLSACAKYAVGQ